jgi:hypothetical protein
VVTRRSVIITPETRDLPDDEVQEKITNRRKKGRS